MTESIYKKQTDNSFSPRQVTHVLSGKKYPKPDSLTISQNRPQEEEDLQIIRPQVWQYLASTTGADAAALFGGRVDIADVILQMFGDRG